MAGEGLDPRKPEHVQNVDQDGQKVTDGGATRAVRVKQVGDDGATVVGVADESQHLEGVTGFTPVGGAVHDSPEGDVGEDEQGTFRMTPKRALHANLRDDAGAEIPLQTLLEAVRDRIGALTTPAAGSLNKQLGDLDASFGDTTDAGTAAGGAGTAQAKLRKLTSQLNDLANLIGEVQANPTANTLQDRLKRAVTALEIMDDWDESDRAKVNPVVGQAGVRGGSGIVTANTQRTVLATDVPLPAGTNAIGKVRTRDEDEAFLYHDAGGVISVTTGDWVTLASITVPDGKTLKLEMAEGDFSDIGSLGATRAIRIRKAGVVLAVALTGQDQPNPDIEGLTLSNASGGNETWDIQGRHNNIGALDMVGWFTWVEVSD